MRRSLAFLVLLALAIAAASCGGKQAFEPLKSGPAGSPPAFALPLLSQLPNVQQPHRRVSAATYELLATAPVAGMTSGNGSATYTPGQIVLDPSLNGGLAWAIFALDGFPDTTTVIPTLVEPVRDNACWLGLSDYQKQAWQLIHSVNPGGIPLTDGGRLIKPAPGLKVYVAIIANDQAVTATSLKLTLSADLPGSPVPHLSILSQVVAGMQADFNAATSDPGNGLITKVTYDFGDGTAPDEETDPAAEVHHTYSAAGPVQFTLTILNDQGRTGTEITPLTVADPMREILLVCNSNIPESVDLAAYYASPRTGRAVDPAYILSLQPASDSDPQQITRQNYDDTIRDPIITFLDDPGHTAIKNNVKYILLCKGIPHKIPGTNGGDNTLSTYSSVDSELCLMNSDATSPYPYESWVWNGPNWETFDGKGFYLSNDVSFVPQTFGVSTASKQFKLDYLVGRLSAYTYDDTKGEIDRALRADTSGTGWTIFDSQEDKTGEDTMLDPVWPWTDNSQNSGTELLQGAGFNVYPDRTADNVYFNDLNLPAGAGENVIGYCSWGVHNGNPATYILLNLGFTYRPGACFMSYESFNGETFTCSNPNDLTQGHSGQGQIADFLHMGGTVAIGNCWEPWTIGVGDERWVFDRYIDHGDRWIEAAYKGLRLLSWMEVVVGDPLCRVKP